MSKTILKSLFLIHILILSIYYIDTFYPEILLKNIHLKLNSGFFIKILFKFKLASLVIYTLCSLKQLSNMVIQIRNRCSILNFLILSSFIIFLLIYLELPFKVNESLFRNLENYQQLISIPAGFIFALIPYLIKKPKIENPTKYIKNKNSFKLKGNQYLPINNPQGGIFIAGNPGCGKTKYVIEPIIYKMIKKKYCGIIYDYDFSSEGNTKNYSLSTLAMNCWKNYSPKEMEFYTINFSELKKSSRINPIFPPYIQNRSLLDEYLETLMTNLNKQYLKKPDFWNQNAVMLLMSIIIYLSNNHKKYCTLPHAVLLGMQPVEKLAELLKSDEEALLYAGSFFDALNNAPEQLAGILSSFKTAFRKLLNKNVMWVLTGNDLPPIVNDSQSPYIVCIGNTPENKTTYSPAIATIISMLVSQMYGHKRNQSFVIMDELPSLYIPKLSEIPATSRKYGISTIVALQNISQLEKTYGVIGAKEIQETFGNKIIGKSEYSVSKYVSEMFGEYEKESKSYTISKAKFNEGSETSQHKKEKLLSSKEIIELKTGEFVGKIIESNQDFFKLGLSPINKYSSKVNYKNLEGLDNLHNDVNIEANYRKIIKEIEGIVKIPVTTL